MSFLWRKVGEFLSVQGQLRINVASKAEICSVNFTAWICKVCRRLSKALFGTAGMTLLCAVLWQSVHGRCILSVGCMLGVLLVSWCGDLCPYWRILQMLALCQSQEGERDWRKLLTKYLQSGQSLLELENTSHIYYGYGGMPHVVSGQSWKFQPGRAQSGPAWPSLAQLGPAWPRSPSQQRGLPHVLTP